MHSISSLLALTSTSLLLSNVHAHGQMTKPTPRPITQKWITATGGTYSLGNSEEPQISPLPQVYTRLLGIQGVSDTFSIWNGCRGTVYEEGMSEITNLVPGDKVDLQWYVQAPHPGYGYFTIVQRVSNSNGTETYSNKTDTPLVAYPNDFAYNGGYNSSQATVPDISGCDSPGACALQFWWSNYAGDQVFANCADVTISASGQDVAASWSGEADNLGVPVSGSAATTSGSYTSTTPSTSSTASSLDTTTTSTTSSTAEDGSYISSPSTTSTSPSSDGTTPVVGASTEGSTIASTTPTTTSPSTASPSTTTTSSYVSGSSVDGESEGTHCGARIRRRRN